jgi:cobalt/nickel transport protein
MKKIILLAGFISLAAAFWASSHPDGLDKVAETFGFAGRASEQQTLMAGYSLPCLPAGPINTALSGLAGILILLGIFSSLRLIAKKIIG